jgi:outer membrane protein assembly factor BamB
MNGKKQNIRQQLAIDIVAQAGYLSRMVLHRWLCTVVLCLFSAGVARADDWPRFRGSHQNGISQEKDWRWDWPAGGPKRLWKASVGQGFSNVAVANGRLFTLGSEDDTATVYCLDASSGREIWKHSYPEPLNAHFYEGGVSTTPTIDGETVYVLGRQGDLFSFQAESGKINWQKNVAQEIGAKVPEWGFAGAPLVEGRSLILNVGSAGMAVNKQNGKMIWASTNGPAGYASPVPFNASQQRPVLIFSHRELVAVEPRTGKELWRFPFQTEYDINAMDPMIYGGRIFLASHSQPGLLLKVLDGRPEVMWRSEDTLVHINSGVLFQDYLYVFNGSAGKQGDLRCLDLRNGEVKWKETGLGVGSLSAAANNKLIVLSAKGELLVAEASPQGFQPLARAQVIGGKCWTAPVLAQGKIFVRNAKGDLVCVDVSR